MTHLPATRVETPIDDAAARHPERIALIFAERRWTYAALHTEMNRRAAVLIARGLASGSVVATTEPVTDDLAISFLACCPADLTMLALSSKLTATECARLLGRINPALVLTGDGVQHPAAPAVCTAPLALPGQAAA